MSAGVARVGSRRLLAAIEEAERASRWSFDSLAVDGTTGGILMAVTRAGETRPVRLSPRQAEWIGGVLPKDHGSFSLTAVAPDGRIDVDIVDDGSAILTIGHDTPSGGREISLPRSLGSTWKNIAREARAAAQTAKDGAR